MEGGEKHAVEIDFRKMLREEKMRAREKRRNRTPQKEDIETNSVPHGDLHPVQNAISPADEGDKNKIISNASISRNGNLWPVNSLSGALEKGDDDVIETTCSDPPIAVLPSLETPHVGNRYLVGNIQNVYYVPGFIANNFVQKELLPWLRAQPDADKIPPETRPDYYNGKWKRLLHAKRKVMLIDDSNMPEPLNRVIDALVSSGVFRSSPDGRPNHVLINEYQDGEGILPHTDGPQYHSKTATLSIGGSVLLKFAQRLKSREVGVKSPDPVLEVLLDGNGSLVVFSDDAYDNHCHSIEEVYEETSSGICANAEEGTMIKRGYRISLTFRHKKRRA